MNRYTFISLIALLALVIIIPLYATQEPVRMAEAQDKLQDEYLQDASEVYLEFCGECHGPTGEGIGLNPALNRLGLAEADPDVLFRIIARATHGSTMASWHLDEGGILNDYQIRGLVTLIRIADWKDVEQMATDKGMDFQGLATRNIEDISVSMKAQEDPHLCISCHEDPKVHAGQFGLDCVRCHTLDAWLPASLTRHNFRLDHGGEGEVACETCHIETYAVNTCYECHEHQPADMVAVHETEGIYEFDFCISCHPTGDEGEGGKIWQEFIQQQEEQQG